MYRRFGGDAKLSGTYASTVENLSREELALVEEFNNSMRFEATLKGLDKLLLNAEKFNEDLEKNWAVVAEAIQTILRRENYPNPYEALKELTRTNSVIDKNAIHTFIGNLNISDAVKEELLRITPQNYLGITS